MMQLQEFLDRLRNSAERDIEIALHRAHVMSPLIMPSELPALLNQMLDVMTGSNAKPAKDRAARGRMPLKLGEAQ